MPDIASQILDELPPVFGLAALRQRFGAEAEATLHRLAENGRLEAVGQGLYRRLQPEAPPRLAFNRAWSNPTARLEAEHLIAVTIARPTYRDVARLCRAYGVGRVRAVLEALAQDGELPPERAAEWRHRLGNIEQGFRDAAARLAAG